MRGDSGRAVRHQREVEEVDGREMESILTFAVSLTNCKWYK